MYSAAGKPYGELNPNYENLNLATDPTPLSRRFKKTYDKNT